MTSIINQNSKVTLNFSIALENGDLVDSNFGKEPATFEMGDGSLLPGFESSLRGLSAGDKKEFLISKENGFGVSNPNNIQSFKPSDFASGLELSEGLIVSFADASGGELPGVIKSIGDDIEVDFNHPLAGHELMFAVEIIKIVNS